MRLMTVELENFRRFEDPATVDVSTDVVAIVGPNEAGKSSFLNAMVALNPDGEFEDRDKTRGVNGPVRVKASYVLDDEDRKALAEFDGGARVRWWTYELRGETRYFNLYPRPLRDRGNRDRLAKFVRNAERSKWFKLLAEQYRARYQDQRDAALVALSRDTEDLDDEDVEAVQQLGASLLEALDAASGYFASANGKGEEDARRARSNAEELSRFMESQNPHKAAGEKLIERRPLFVLFDQADRDLRGSYDLQGVITNIPSALRNLAQLARLDLRALLMSIRSGDGGARETLLHNANAVLAEKFQEAWRQSSVAVHLSTQGSTLEIMISARGERITELAERSDGLRAFVALRAFLDKLGLSRLPILLIDEAETHLHYDAQADLVNLFHTQRLAAKVIYTTHSAGCLPRDLGNGVRVIAPIRGRERSSARNSIWSGTQAGFSPLVYAMGATTFAFLPSRFVVLCEGDTDAMLYPTLFREAIGSEDVGFQVAPGLASVSAANMLSLMTEGGRVLFLTDGDDVGRDYRGRLEEHGIRGNHTFGLDQYVGDCLQLEDLINSSVYVEAVNEVIRDFQDLEEEIAVSDIPSSARARAVVEWSRSKGCQPPSKRSVALRLLEAKSESARQGKELLLLDRQYRRPMRSLHKRLVKHFA